MTWNGSSTYSNGQSMCMAGCVDWKIRTLPYAFRRLMPLAHEWWRA